MKCEVVYPCCEISRVGARNVATCVAARRNILFAISPYLPTLMITLQHYQEILQLG